MAATLTPRDLTTLADRKIKRRIENISGVGSVRLVGASKREVNVLIDPARIQALGAQIRDDAGRSEVFLLGVLLSMAALALAPPAPAGATICRPGSSTIARRW